MQHIHQYVTSMCARHTASLTQVLQEGVVELPKWTEEPKVNLLHSGRGGGGGGGARSAVEQIVLVEH